MKASTGSQFTGSPARPSTIVRRLFPDGVAAAEMRETADPGLLYPEEAVSVERAVAKRIGEFAAGRACARLALAEIGIHDFAIRTAKDRQPLWPTGVIGSITHTTGFYAAVAARVGDLIAIGLDCEVVGKITSDIWESISRPEEMQWIQSLPPPQQAAGVALIFAAKEAFYKCQYPLTAEWLDFHDIRVQALGWGSEASEFVIEPIRALVIEPIAATPMVGRYVLHDQFILSGIALRGRV